MKLIPDEKKVMERMAPGALCLDGFLGHDRRTLHEIIEADTNTVARLGTTHEAVADKLGEVVRAAMAGLGRPVEIDGGRMTAVFHDGMGHIPSPWADGVVAPKGEIELTVRDTGRVLRFSPLSVLLIRMHGFYEGHGSRYRLDPGELAELFGLAGEGE